MTLDGQPCLECGGTAFVFVENEQLGEAGPLILGCENGHEFYVPAEATARSRIGKLRAIVRDHSAARIDGYLVDATTASMLVAVYQALSPVNRELFGKPELSRLVALGWKHVK